MTTQVDGAAEVDPTAVLGARTRVWGLAQVREGAVIGDDCVIGRMVYIGPGVRIGDRVKIQNLSQVYDPAVIEDGAFVGPAVVLTNDKYPRAVTPAGQPSSAADWEAVGVTVREGASIGARSVCVAPVVLGRWCLVGAGATVIADVPDFAVVAGTPAHRIGWAGKAGRRLLPGTQPGTWDCPVTGERYVESNGELKEKTA